MKYKAESDDKQEQIQLLVWAFYTIEQMVKELLPEYIEKVEHDLEPLNIQWIDGSLVYTKPPSPKLIECTDGTLVNTKIPSTKIRLSDYNEYENGNISISEAAKLLRHVMAALDISEKEIKKRWKKEED